MKPDRIRQLLAISNQLQYAERLLRDADMASEADAIRVMGFGIWEAIRACGKPDANEVCS